MGEFSKDDLLRSWKEIAAYLGCDVRTCYRWEHERGLPVHRAEDAEKKSPVFAYKHELDAWFREAFKSSNPLESERRAYLWLKWAGIGATALILAAIILYVRGRLVPRQPADFRIDGSVLYILDAKKHELWRWDTGVEDLQTDSYYRSNFQVKHTDQSNILPSLAMKDIDGDGNKEVLFALKTVRDQTGEGVLVCFDRRGRERWRFQAGRELVCASQRFSPDFRIAGFHTRDIDKDGRREIFVESFHAPDWPCQLAMLDASGKLVGEFWNAGYLRELTYQDLDGDGREELIVVGVNNEYRGGCLVVFDPQRISGGSPQTGDFVCHGIGPGSMISYVTVPYTDVSAARGRPVDGLRTVEITANNWIRATTSNGIIYEFDFSLKCVQVTFGHGFMIDHYETRKAGAVTSVLDDGYKANLIGGIRYWNGSAWAAESSMVRR